MGFGSGGTEVLGVTLGLEDGERGGRRVGEMERFGWKVGFEMSEQI